MKKQALSDLVVWPPAKSIKKELGTTNYQDATVEAERAVDGGPIFVGLRGQAAVDALLQSGHGEARAALTHPLLGDIDHIYGEHDHPKNNRKQGHGLAHVRDGHPEMLVDDLLQRVLARLVPLEHQRRPDYFELVGRLKGRTYRAVVRTTWNNGAGQTAPKTWLMTIFPRRQQ